MQPKHLQLAPRLQLLADLVPQGALLADIGTDHGYLPVWLLQQGRISSAIAADIGAGPLEHARRTAREYDVYGLAFRLCDGLSAIAPDEADTLVIAGMGGGLVIHILTEGAKVLKSVETLVLQPQSEFARVRDYLEKNEYRIEEEHMLCEDGKYYAMMRVKHGKMTPLTEIEQKYGPVLLAKKDPVLKEFLEREERKFTEIREHLAQMEGEKAAFRKKEVEKELEDIRAAKERLD